MIVITANQIGELFCAVSEEKQAVGKTIGEAVDALILKLKNRNQENLYVIQRPQSDEQCPKNKNSDSVESV